MTSPWDRDWSKQPSITDSLSKMVKPMTSDTPSRAQPKIVAGKLQDAPDTPSEIKDDKWSDVKGHLGDAVSLFTGEPARHKGQELDQTKAGKVMNIPGQLGQAATKSVANVLGDILGFATPEKVKEGLKGMGQDWVKGMKVLGEKPMPGWTYAGKQDKTVGEAFDSRKLAEMFGKSMENLEADIGPEGMKFWENVGGIADWIPLGTGGKAVAKKTGDVVEGFGKGSLRKAVLPKDVTSKRAAKSVMKGADKIIDDIARFNVQTANILGKPGDAALKSQSKIDDLLIKGDNAVSEALKRKPNIGVDSDIAFNQLKDDIISGKEGLILVDEKDAALNLIDKIKDGLAQEGFSGFIPVREAIDMKRRVGAKAFKKGSFQMSDDAFKDRVKELMNLKLREEIAKDVKGLNSINKDIHDLLNVKLALEEADKRLSGHRAFGIMDGFALLALQGGGEMIDKLPGIEMSGPTLAGLMLMNQAYKKGRGPSALITAGKALKGDYMPRLPEKPVSGLVDKMLGRGKVKPDMSIPDVFPGARYADAPVGEFGIDPEDVIKMAPEKVPGGAYEGLSDDPISNLLELAERAKKAPKKTKVDADPSVFDPVKTVSKADEGLEAARGKFLSDITADVRKQVSSGNQWDYVSGQKVRDAKGNLIKMDESTRGKLQKLADDISRNYNNSFDFRQELDALGIEPPTSPDDIMEWIREGYGKRGKL